jgi:aminoglycoside 6'-N-acetyltransferase I
MMNPSDYISPTSAVTHPGITVRHISLRDGEGWLALRRQLWPEEDAEELAEGVSRFFAQEERRVGMMPEAVLVAVQSGNPENVVGFAELSRRLYAEGCETSPVGFLEGWYVASSLRGRGIGRMLVREAEAWARAQGCREFASDAVAENLASAAAHRALGFEEVEVIRCFRKALTENPPL